MSGGGNAGQPPTVVFCSNTLRYLWNFRRSTIERFLRRGAKVLCIGQADRTAVLLESIGCEVLGLDWRLRTLNPVHELGIVRLIVGALARARPVLVFSFTFKANFDVACACSVLGIPYVTNVSGLGTAFLNDGVAYRLLRRLYGLANARAYATFFQNPSDLALFKALRISAGRRTAVLPGSGVDTAHFAFDRVERPVRTFLMISRLIRDKGVVEFLEAAEIAKARRPELRFVLVGPEEGDGPRRVSKADVARYPAVDYLGEMEDVRPVLYDCECLVLPSYREGLPRTVLEAASAGRIALVSDVEGCRDAIVPEETGFLFPARSSAALAEAMLTLADQDVRRVAAMSEAARALATSRFSEELCITPYEQLYEELRAAERRVA